MSYFCGGGGGVCVGECVWFQCALLSPPPHHPGPRPAPDLWTQGHMGLKMGPRRPVPPGYHGKDSHDCVEGRRAGRALLNFWVRGNNGAHKHYHFTIILHRDIRLQCSIYLSLSLRKHNNDPPPPQVPVWVWRLGDQGHAFGRHFGPSLAPHSCGGGGGSYGGTVYIQWPG